MDLIKNIKENEYGEMEGEVFFQYYNNYIELRFDKEIPMDYIQKSAEQLSGINQKLIEQICEKSLRFCQETIKNYPDVGYDEGLKNIEKPLDLLKYMEIEELVIDMFNDRDIQVMNL